MNAILARNSSTAVLLYVDLFIEGVFGQQQRPEAWHIGRKLAGYLQKFPELRAEFRKRYEVAASGPFCSILENLFGEICDEDDLTAMVKKYSVNGRPYDGVLARAVRKVALRLTCGSALENCQ